MSKWPWIAGGVGVLGLVLLSGGKKAHAAPPPGPAPRPPPGPAPAPRPLPGRNVPPPGAVRTATISAPSGANVRAFPPSVSARIVARIPQGSRVGIMEEGPPLPPTAGMQGGWQKIRTSAGVDGYVALADAQGVRILHFDDEPAEEIFTAGYARWAPRPYAPFRFRY